MEKRKDKPSLAGLISELSEVNRAGDEGRCGAVLEAIKSSDPRDTMRGVLTKAGLNCKNGEHWEDFLRCFEQLTDLSMQGGTDLCDRTYGYWYDNYYQP